MARFITLATIDEGAGTDQSSLTEQIDLIEKALEADTIQGQVAAAYATVGEFDLVVISEIPTAEGAAAFARAVRELTRGRATTLTQIDTRTVDEMTPLVRDGLGRPAVGRPAVGRPVDELHEPEG
jgi:uncharacterized protein with GYD domain